jgi:PadR family transcriptional regulator PadR
VLLAVILRLGEYAYGMPIGRELEEKGRREVLMGSVYAALDRLESKGLVSSSMGDPTPERGGRAKKYFRPCFHETRIPDLVRQDIPIIWTRRERARGPSSSAIKTRCHCPSTTSPPLTCSVRWWPSNIARKCESAFIRSQSEWSGLL